MNANLLAVVNRIVAEQGETILADAKRLFPFFADYAKNEHKEERVAFGRCIEYGAYNELKNTRTPDERQRLKATLANQINAKIGVDRPRCADALDLLEAVIFKPPQSQYPPQKTYPQQQHTPAYNSNGNSTLLLDYKFDTGQFNENFQYFSADGKTISLNILFNRSTATVVTQVLLMSSQIFALKAEIYNDKISFLRLTALGLGKPSGDKFEINGSQIASVEMENTFLVKSITIITKSKEKL